MVSQLGIVIYDISFLCGQEDEDVIGIDVPPAEQKKAKRDIEIKKESTFCSR